MTAPKPHPQAKEIRAFADGAVIEQRKRKYLREQTFFDWHPTSTPRFGDPDAELRIAPIQPADSEGWRPWYGGENPAGDKDVDYEIKSGKRLFCVRASAVFWRADLDGSTIVRWRESAEQPDLPPPDPGFGPWIRWSGGENPVRGEEIMAQFRDGSYGRRVILDDYAWSHKGNIRIIAYCVKEPEKVRRWRWQYVTANGNFLATSLYTEVEIAKKAATEFEKVGAILGPRLDWTVTETDQ